MKIPTPRAINCPNCGGNVELRGFTHSRSAVCIHCCTILDPSTPELTVLQKFDERNRVAPLLPLGARGLWLGSPYEVIGFQVRTASEDDEEYSWHEYLLFNPYKGFRYLTVFDGHWNDVVVAHGLPTFTSVQGHKAAQYAGFTFRHFSHAVATTSFVVGEFPWAVRVGETNEVDDYVAPPRMLSSEMTEGEINWSLGSYVEAAAVYQAFHPQVAPPQATGVFANQPPPQAGRASGAWSMFFKLMLAWAVLLAIFTFTASNKEVFRASHRFSQADPGEHSFVTPVFDLEGRGNAEIELRTDLSNNWAYFNLALLRDDGAQGYDFGREVSYYSGSDSDGAWSEGKAKDSVTLPRVPAGRYYLRVEPEMDAQASAKAASGTTMNYEIVVRRDVPDTWMFWLGLPLLLIPPIVVSVRASADESRRWQASNYASTAASGGDE